MLIFSIESKPYEYFFEGDEEPRIGDAFTVFAEDANGRRWRYFETFMQHVESVDEFGRWTWKRGRRKPENASLKVLVEMVKAHVFTVEDNSLWERCDE